MDRDGAELFATAAERASVRRFLIVSSMAADAGHPGDEVFDVYLRAKGAADDAVRAHRNLDWTVLRPGSLTDDAGTGKVRLEASTGRGSVPRDDVARVLMELIDTPATAGLTLELISGENPGGGRGEGRRGQLIRSRPLRGRTRHTRRTPSFRSGAEGGGRLSAAGQPIWIAVSCAAATAQAVWPPQLYTEAADELATTHEPRCFESVPR